MALNPRRIDIWSSALSRVLTFLSAGSVIADLELSFNKLSYDVILLLEEALYINKSLGAMKIDWVEASYVNGI